MSKVTQIPLSFIIATEDEECLPSYGENIIDAFSGAEEKYVQYEEGWTHEHFGFMASTDFVDRMVKTIDNGTANDEELVL